LLSGNILVVAAGKGQEKGLNKKIDYERLPPTPRSLTLTACQTMLWFVTHSSSTLAGKERLRDDLKELQAISGAFIYITIYFKQSFF